MHIEAICMLQVITISFRHLQTLAADICLHSSVWFQICLFLLEFLGYERLNKEHVGVVLRLNCIGSAFSHSWGFVIHASTYAKVENFLHV